MNQNLRNLPKVDELLKDPRIQRESMPYSRRLLNLRESLEQCRKEIIGGKDAFSREELFEKVVCLCEEKNSEFSDERLKTVINATGVVMHTNLGRSLLCHEAAQRLLEVSTNYNNLEYSTTKGKRRSRLSYVEEVLKDLTGAEAALVVNNNAAAVFLVLNTICCGKEAILSRGEIVEIGDSFRISGIIKTSGDVITEIGTTNRTNINDYEEAITDGTGALLKVHTSNFKVVGYTSEATAKELAALGARRSIPAVEDMGSGLFVDLSQYGFKYERQVKDAVADGMDLVTFSGDKVLGGPQAGIIVGKKKYIDLMRRNQLMRCLRVDKLCLAALEATLSHYFENDILKIPTLRDALSLADEVLSRAQQLFERLQPANPQLNLELKEHLAEFGGGSLPFEVIPSYAIFITSPKISAQQIEKQFRMQPVPLICTVQNDEVILDLRTVQSDSFGLIEEYFRNLK